MSKDKLQFLSPLFLKYQNDLEKNPRSRVFAPLAESYRKVGMTDKALEVLSQGIRYNPSYVMGYLGLAFCYYDLKQFNLAYTTIRPLVESNRDNLRLQKLFADICINLNLDEEGLETLKYLLFINPKDKEVASLVLKLESKVDQSYINVHTPIVIPPDVFKSEEKESVQFDLKKLDTSPTIDFDDWLHVDLHPKTKNEDDVKEINESWVMNSLSSESENSTSKISLDLENEKTILVEEEKASEVIHEAPIVTHTLVDLYCGQGHIEKAISILEKILLLNPNDQKTKDKILEIKSLISPAEEITNDIENQTNSLISVDELENTSEEDGRRNLMNILDLKILRPDEQDFEDNEERSVIIEKKLLKFLEKIKERALDYQSRF
jgi:tetratricopeptide (TPR) repeat protein